ncbi:ATP-binding protein [Patescibacteria group bacterium]|nr:ATP-binding protein [Patescibacteria group bacterium]
MNISRAYSNLGKIIEPNKVIVIYGPRRVGKTTLLEQYIKKTKLKYRFDTGEDIRIQEVLSSQRIDKLKQYAGDNELIILDEAQLVPNIGIGLKLIVDQIKNIKVIATGSASFDLSNKIGEPLVGRKWTKTLYPVSQFELAKIDSKFDLLGKLEQFLIFGSYPEVLTSKTIKRKREILDEIVGSYLLKDILTMEQVKSPKKLLDLLKLIAFQLGGEVSLTELGSQLDLDKKTVHRYLDLLEKTFILFNLRGYSRNLRKAVSKKSKYYFWDNGIRNAIINNFNPLDTRNDLGQLWENFLAVERLKKQEYAKIFSNNYFWRTWDQDEIDWVEERGGRLHGYEFKFKKSRIKPPKIWKETYKQSSFKVINKNNYLDFVI